MVISALVSADVAGDMTSKATVGLGKWVKNSEQN